MRSCRFISSHVVWLIHYQSGVLANLLPITQTGRFATSLAEWPLCYQSHIMADWLPVMWTGQLATSPLQTGRFAISLVDWPVGYQLRRLAIASHAKATLSHGSGRCSTALRVKAGLVAPRQLRGPRQPRLPRLPCPAAVGAPQPLMLRRASWTKATLSCPAAVAGAFCRLLSPVAVAGAPQPRVIRLALWTKAASWIKVAS